MGPPQSWAPYTAKPTEISSPTFCTKNWHVVCSLGREPFNQVRLASCTGLAHSRALVDASVAQLECALAWLGSCTIIQLRPGYGIGWASVDCLSEADRDLFLDALYQEMERRANATPAVPDARTKPAVP